MFIPHVKSRRMLLGLHVLSIAVHAVEEIALIEQTSNYFLTGEKTSTSLPCLAQPHSEPEHRCRFVIMTRAWLYSPSLRHTHFTNIPFLLSYSTGLKINEAFSL